MSSYIVCPSTSMFLAPSDRPLPHSRRPPHPPRHRLDDRRYGHHGASAPSAAMPRHHRLNGYNHPQTYHHQHPAGDYPDFHYHPQHPHNRYQYNHYSIYSCPGIYRLHEEILSFYEDMRPRPEERLMRDDVVRRITDAIRSRWSGTRVEVFGSMKTGLYLPTSDIDLVVFHNWDRTPFCEIRDELLARGICTDRTIKVLDNASVPIIKLTDQLTQVKVDIGFNIANGQRSAELVQSYIHQFPALPYLVIVLKQFLYQRELNEVYSGGISSYSLILLTISFLQTQSSFGHMPINANYGVLLLEFFHVYARLFVHPRVVVSILRGPQVVRYYSENTCQLPSLSIEDPLCSENDVARGSYNVSRVQLAFAAAVHVLTSELSRPVYSCPSPTGMLSSIVRVPAEIERYRSWVQNRFPLPSSSIIMRDVTREAYLVSSSSSGISSASSPEPHASASSSASSIISEQDTDDEDDDDDELNDSLLQQSEASCPTSSALVQPSTESIVKCVPVVQSPDAPISFIPPASLSDESNVGTKRQVAPDYNHGDSGDQLPAAQDSDSIPSSQSLTSSNCGDGNLITDVITKLNVDVDTLERDKGASCENDETCTTDESLLEDALSHGMPLGDNTLEDESHLTTNVIKLVSNSVSVAPSNIESSSTVNLGESLDVGNLSTLCGHSYVETEVNYVVKSLEGINVKTSSSTNNPNKSCGCSGNSEASVSVSSVQPVHCIGDKLATTSDVSGNSHVVQTLNTHNSGAPNVSTFLDGSGGEMLIGHDVNRSQSSCEVTQQVAGIVIKDDGDGTLSRRCIEMKSTLADNKSAEEHGAYKSLFKDNQPIQECSILVGQRSLESEPVGFSNGDQNPA